MASRNYRDLITWQKAMDLVVAVYQATRGFPKEELFVLTSQVRRAAVSIPSNIAEGQGRGGDPEFVRFLRIGHGSLREVETQLLIAERLNYLQRDNVRVLMDRAAEVGKLMNGLIRSKDNRGES
jgi:four helix bundle protein